MCVLNHNLTSGSPVELSVVKQKFGQRNSFWGKWIRCLWNSFKMCPIGTVFLGRKMMWRNSSLSLSHTYTHTHTHTHTVQCIYLECHCTYTFTGTVVWHLQVLFMTARNSDLFRKLNLKSHRVRPDSEAVLRCEWQTFVSNILSLSFYFIFIYTKELVDGNVSTDL
jgi:hypothetical protein